MSEATGVLAATTAAGRRGAPRVLLAVEDLSFHQEVLDHLERDSRLEVVAAVSDPDRLRRVLGRDDVDGSVGCPSMAASIRLATPGIRSGPLFLVTEEMTVPILRDAIDMGAAGVYAWPEERAELSDSLARMSRPGQPKAHARGSVLAVMGARGGAGATFIASHLAAALAAIGRRTVILDLEPAPGALSMALGVPAEDHVRTIADLLPVVDELSLEHVQDALQPHVRGFDALLGPRESEPGIHPAMYRVALSLLVEAYDAIVLHLPRSDEHLRSLGSGVVDEMLVVTTQDLFSLHGAKRFVETRVLDRAAHLRVVVNGFRRSGAAVSEIGSLLGVEGISTVRFDRAVARAQERGELLSARARGAARDVARLARRIDESAASPARPDHPALEGLP